MSVLSKEQKLRYEQDGYLVVREVFNDSEIESMQARFREIVEGKVSGHPEDRVRIRDVPGRADFGSMVAKGKPPGDPDPHTSRHRRRGTQVFPVGGEDLQELAWQPIQDPMDAVTHMTALRYDEGLSPFIRHEGILDIVSRLMSPNIKLYYDQVFAKAPYGGPNRYHQDSVFWNFFASKNLVTAWVAVDESTEQNGCVRYLPGSHQFGLVDWEHIPHLLTEEVLEQETPALVRPGDVVFHNSLTFHCSGPNLTGQRRWGWAMHYVAAETRYIGTPEEDEHLWKIGALEKEGPRNGFPLIRGEEFPGRV